MKVLVTGVNGFIGKALCCRLFEDKFDIIGTVQRNEIVPGIQKKYKYLKREKLTDKPNGKMH